MLSQASAGWSALHEIYDDGGISGGTLEMTRLGCWCYRMLHATGC